VTFLETPKEVSRIFQLHVETQLKLHYPYSVESHCSGLYLPLPLLRRYMQK